MEINQNPSQINATQQQEPNTGHSELLKKIDTSFQVLLKGLAVAQSKGAFTLEDAHALYTQITLMRSYLKEDSESD